MVLDAPRICKSDHPNTPWVREPTVEVEESKRGSPLQEQERTLEGVVESAAAFWEEVSCDGEKSGWLDGIIFPVTSGGGGGGVACGWANERIDGRGSQGSGVLKAEQPGGRPGKSAGNESLLPAICNHARSTFADRWA